MRKSASHKCESALTKTLESQQKWVSNLAFHHLALLIPLALVLGLGGKGRPRVRKEKGSDLEILVRLTFGQGPCAIYPCSKERVESKVNDASF